MPIVKGVFCVAHDAWCAHSFCTWKCADLSMCTQVNGHLSYQPPVEVQRQAPQRTVPQRHAMQPRPLQPPNALGPLLRQIGTFDTNLAQAVAAAVHGQRAAASSTAPDVLEAGLDFGFNAYEIANENMRHHSRVTPSASAVQGLGGGRGAGRGAGLGAEVGAGLEADFRSFDEHFKNSSGDVSVLRFVLFSLQLSVCLW